MITEKDRQAILNGTWGVTRDGCKCKVVYKNDNLSDKQQILIIIENNTKTGGYITKWLNWDLREFSNYTSVFDIVKLWKDKPEPFDLEKALAGELFVHKEIPNVKCKLVGKSTFNTTDEYYVVEREDSIVTIWSLFTLKDYCAMWKEPEPVSNMVKPRKSDTQNIGYLNSQGENSVI